MLENDHGFSLTFTGSAVHTEAWNGVPNSEHVRVSWSGELAFPPTGCTENTLTSPLTLRTCYPG
ncbi:MAG TPA: hypothetical protein VEF89_11490 [Solirubrobacteraceae bacterium]|nr:hypothetical protein [Solirubrobacteraceae bacterium]